MKRPTDESVAALTTALDSYTTTRQRLKGAGQRAAIAETMRRAAIAEMGAALRDHRAVLANSPGSSARIDMDDAQNLTGISRRTLSDAIGKTDTRGDKDIATEYRDYAYDLHHGGYELHRRYPHLAGLYEAYMLLLRTESERWSTENPDELFERAGERTEEQLALRREYERRVNAIADGQPDEGL